MTEEKEQTESLMCKWQFIRKGRKRSEIYSHGQKAMKDRLNKTFKWNTEAQSINSNPNFCVTKHILNLFDYENLLKQNIKNTFSRES